MNLIIFKDAVENFQQFRCLKCGGYVKVIWEKQEGKAQMSGSDSSRPSLGIGKSCFGDKQMFLTTWRNGRVCPPERQKCCLPAKYCNGQMQMGQKFHRKKLFELPHKWGEILWGTALIERVVWKM